MTNAVYLGLTKTSSQSLQEILNFYQDMQHFPPPTPPPDLGSDGNQSQPLKCYSQTLLEGLLKILDFSYFVLIWWQQSCKDLFIRTELPIV